MWQPIQNQYHNILILQLRCLFFYEFCWSVMSTYFCPHLMFNSGYLIEFVCLKSDLIDNSDN